MLERARAAGVAAQLPELLSRLTLTGGGQEPDAGQMVAVHPAAGTSEDGADRHRWTSRGCGGQMDPGCHLCLKGLPKCNPAEGGIKAPFPSHRQITAASTPFRSKSQLNMSNKRKCASV